ncbi:MAG: DUF1697 domain-containing protein [Acidobacteriota bacterium]|nr:MAG: DUF1697 domain-containing protein [Acidobacteriota bacterium]
MSISTRIALLRGINITGNRTLPMADLRSLCEEIGLVDPVTYIASGNVIFGSDDPAAEIENAIHAAINAAFGYDVKVMVRTPSKFEEILQGNPYADRDPKSLAVTLLADDADPERLEPILDGEYGNDEFAVTGDVVYLHLPDGYGRTKLHNNFFESKLKTSATTRNWRTMNKLAEVARNR